jgi:hypothetical protein
MGVGPILNSAQVDAQTRSQLNQLEAELPFSVPELFMLVGVIGLLPGIALLVLGFFVRGGGMGAVITSIVFTGLCALGLLLMLVGTLASLAGGGGGAGAGGPSPLPGMAIFAGLLALVLLLLYWLIQAARNASQISAMQAQYQSQYWQYQQQQQAYQQPPSPQQPQQGWPPPPPPPANPDPSKGESDGRSPQG